MSGFMDSGSIQPRDYNALAEERKNKYLEAVNCNDCGLFRTVVSCTNLKDAKRVVKERFNIKITDEEFFGILDNWYLVFKRDLVEQVENKEDVEQ